MQRNTSRVTFGADRVLSLGVWKRDVCDRAQSTCLRIIVLFLAAVAKRPPYERRECRSSLGNESAVAGTQPTRGTVEAMQQPLASLREVHSGFLGSNQYRQQYSGQYCQGIRRAGRGLGLGSAKTCRFLTPWLDPFEPWVGPGDDACAWA